MIDFLQDRGPAALWWSSGLFSALVLAGYAFLDRQGFAVLLIAVALANVVVAATRRSPVTRTLLLSQSMIGVATVVAVVLYLEHFVGLGPTVAGVVLDFLRESTTDARTYLHLLVYALSFATLVALAQVLVSALFGQRPERLRVLATLYAASAVNLACDYALRRPLFQVGGEPDAVGFFFAAGLFGLESSLPLHFLLLVACAVVYRRS